VITSSAINAKAMEIGFDLCGVAPVDSFPELEFLREWFDRGYAGEMAWMPRSAERRADVRNVLPGARSVIVTGTLYNTDRPYSRDLGPDVARISRYAWGDDYHDVLKQKLESLLAWIREQEPAAAGKVCVDIQPTLDKSWAVRAGLGWLGKHTNVITQEYGSWVFIGELLLNLDLEPDVPELEDHCGTCTLCIDACPTQAITEPYVVDSNKCISYATIELRTPELPEHVQEGISGWLYGCDVCQDVCPWNRFQQTTNETRFEPREGNVNAELDQVLRLTPEAYAARFRGSAMKRAKLAGLQRNARALLSDQPGPPA
jgi:epoxyqueuosine reductase